MAKIQFAILVGILSPLGFTAAPTRAGDHSKPIAGVPQTYSHRCIHIKASDAAATVRRIIGEPLAGAKEPAYLSFDSRNNTVHINGPADKIAQAKALLIKLDVGGAKFVVCGHSPILQTYTAPDGKAADLAKALQEVYRSQTPFVRVAALGGDRVMVYAGPEHQQAIARLLKVFGGAPVKRKADESKDLLPAAEKLSAAEQKLIREAAYGHGLTHEIKRIYANKPNATLDLLLKIVEVGRHYDAVQAAGLIAGLIEGPAYGAIVTKLSSLGELDDVIEGTSETLRDRLYAGSFRLIRDAEKARTKQRKLNDELTAALKPFRDANGIAGWLDDPVKFLQIRRVVRPEHHIPLSKLPVLPAVKKLQLHGYDFDDDDLAALAKWTHLERLDIIYCRDVTDKGMAHLRSLKKLKSLIIWGPNKITSAGMQHVRSFPDLESLEIQQTKIGDDGVEPIRHLHKLSNLMLSLTGASPAAVKRLEAALPKCEVLHSEE